MIPDERLIEAAREGNRSAFAELYEGLYPSVYRFAYFHTRSVAEAEDTAADAFLRALEHIRQFRGQPGQFAGWVMRIARNGIVDRGRRTRPESTLDEAPEPPAPDQVAGVVDRVVLRAALATLGDDQRSTVVLRFVVGLSSREVGDVLGKSEGAIEQLQRRGLAALAEELGGPPELGDR